VRTTPVQTPAAAVDIAGISAASSVRSVADPTLGSLWNLAGLAAAQPVHFHPLTPTTFVMVFSRRWYAPTCSGTDPGAYSAHSEDTTPGWVLVSTPGGTRTIGAGYALPTNTPGVRRLVGAASRATNYLYTLTTDDTAVAVLTMIATAPAKPFTITGEETLPNPGGVLFGAGVWIDTPHLIVAGTDADGQVYLARKLWHAVGTNTATGGDSHLSDPTWSYASTAGWSTDPTDLAPVRTTTGVLTSAGPVSHATYTTREFLATVAADGSTRTGVVWTKTGPGTAWTPATSPPPSPATIPLGSVGDGSYLGGTLQFQQALVASPQLLWGNAAAICWVTSVKTGAGTTKLVNTWNTWMVAALARPTPAIGTVSLATPLSLAVSGRAGYFRALVPFGRGQLTATAQSSKFLMAVPLRATGALRATVTIFQLRTFPAVRGTGRLTATRAATKFTFTAPISGRGTLFWLAGVRTTVAFPGRGTVSVIAKATRFTVATPISGRGTVTAKPVPQLSATLQGNGASTAVARMYRINSVAAMGGRGLPTVVAFARYARTSALGGRGTLSASLRLNGATLGTGTLSATAVANKFVLTAPLSGRCVVRGPFYLLAFMFGARLGGQGILSATATKVTFAPFNEENLNRTNQPVPQGASGVWVTLLGAGASGGNGAAGNSGLRHGGSGGGGGARVGRSFIDVSSLGATYSVTRGTTSGAASTVTSGGITLTAGGGSGTTGGTASQSGITGMIVANGSAGSGSTGASNTVGAGAGGGGGGDVQSNDSISSSSAGGTASGGTPTGLNGAGGHGSSATSGSTAPGPGGVGGNYGGGGGGGGARGNVSGPAGQGGAGGPGYTLLEWV